jgi:hypothetical protein
MRTLRGRLRTLATLWMVFQAVSLSALVPPSCCLGNVQAATPPERPRCHEAAPMQSPHGAMHHHSTAPAEHTPARDCAMRAACGGQAAALLAALSTVGVLPQSVAYSDSLSVDVPHSSPERLLGQFQPPDAPPPRL